MFCGPMDEHRFVDVSENAMYWYFVVATWIADLCPHLSRAPPRLIGRWRLAALWSGLLAGPLAWAALLEVNYVLSLRRRARCATKWMLHLSTAVALIVVGLGAVAAWRAWRASAADAAGPQRYARRARARTMAVGGSRCARGSRSSSLRRRSRPWCCGHARIDRTGSLRAAGRAGPLLMLGGAAMRSVWHACGGKAGIGRGIPYWAAVVASLPAG